MSTLTLKPKTAAAKKSKGARKPVRGVAAPRRQLTLAEAQAERAERERQFAQEQRKPHREGPPRSGQGAPRRDDDRRPPRDDRRTAGGAAPRRDDTRPPYGEARPPRGDARPARPDTRPPRSDARPPRPDNRPPYGDTRPPRPDTRPPRSDARPPRPDARPPYGDARPPRDDSRPPRDARPPHGKGGPPRGDARPGRPADRERPKGPPMRADQRPAPRRPEPPRGDAPRPPARPRPEAPPTRADEPAQRSAPTPRNPEEGDRLSKRLTALGIASRREADDWIAAGWVRVDGKLAVLGQRVGPDAQIDIDPVARQAQAQRVTVLLHKPVGYVSGQPEDGHEPAVVLVRPENRWAEDGSGLKFHPGHLRGLAPAGRLDIDSTGLLVLTQDGRVAKALIGEDSTVEKEYLVRVRYTGEGRLPDDKLELLRHGLELDGQALRPARVSWQNEDQLRFALREGRKRQIRRMCEAVGLEVEGLKRVRIGRIALGALPPGQWRYLGPHEKF